VSRREGLAFSQRHTGFLQGSSHGGVGDAHSGFECIGRLAGLVTANNLSAFIVGENATPPCLDTFILKEPKKRIAADAVRLDELLGALACLVPTDDLGDTCCAKPAADGPGGRRLCRRLPGRVSNGFDQFPQDLRRFMGVRKVGIRCYNVNYAKAQTRSRFRN
jgi:hypothetical protein